MNDFEKMTDEFVVVTLQAGENAVLGIVVSKERATFFTSPVAPLSNASGTFKLVPPVWFRINRCATTVLPLRPSDRYGATTPIGRASTPDCPVLPLMGVPLPFPEGRRVVMMDD